jgi:hypothetical protein
MDLITKTATEFNFSNVRNEAVFVAIFGIFIFFQLSFAKKQTILSLILMTILGFVGYHYLYKINEKKIANNKIDTTFFNDEIKDRNEVNIEQFFIKKFPTKKLKFFLKNKDLVEIAKDLIITRVFDKARYADLLNLMNSYQKVYTYILGERYEPVSYISIFIDLGNAILENMYSIYFVVPVVLKHVYGVYPNQIIDKNIKLFTNLHADNIEILKSFTKKQLSYPYFPETDPKPLKNPFNYIENRKLP